MLRVCVLVLLVCTVLAVLAVLGAVHDMMAIT